MKTTEISCNNANKETSKALFVCLFLVFGFAYCRWSFGSLQCHIPKTTFRLKGRASNHKGLFDRFMNTLYVLRKTDLSKGC